MGAQEMPGPRGFTVGIAGWVGAYRSLCELYHPRSAWAGKCRVGRWLAGFFAVASASRSFQILALTFPLFGCQWPGVGSPYGGTWCVLGEGETARFTGGLYKSFPTYIMLETWLPDGYGTPWWQEWFTVGRSRGHWVRFGGSDQTGVGPDLTGQWGSGFMKPVLQGDVVCE